MNNDQALDPQSRDLTIRTIYGEAGDEPIEGQQAVGHVIRNRLLSGRFGGSIPTIVQSGNNFEPWHTAQGLQRMRNISPSAYQQIGGMVDQIFGGQSQDPTGGATYFYSPSAQAQLGRNAPSFAQSDRMTGIIGRHHFFTGPEGPVDTPQRQLGSLLLSGSPTGTPQGFTPPLQAGAFTRPQEQQKPMAYASPPPAPAGSTPAFGNQQPGLSLPSLIRAHAIGPLQDAATGITPPRIGQSLIPPLPGPSGGMGPASIANIPPPATIPPGMNLGPPPVAPPPPQIAAGGGPAATPPQAAPQPAPAAAPAPQGARWAGPAQGQPQAAPLPPATNVATLPSQPVDPNAGAPLPPMRPPGLGMGPQGPMNGPGNMNIRQALADNPNFLQALFGGQGAANPQAQAIGQMLMDQGNAVYGGQ